MDVEVKKKVLRKLTYGLYVVTALDGERARAATVNWLSQASFDPPRVMLAVKKGSGLHELLDEGVPVAVNILAHDQKPVAEAFFRETRREGNTLNGYAFEPGSTGAPLLVDVPAVFEARPVGSLPGGDHTVFVVEVVDAHLRRYEKPLELCNTGWFYGG